MTELLHCRLSAVDDSRDSRLEWLRRDVQAGIDSGMLPGELDIEDIKRRGRERLEQLRKR